MSLYKAKLFEFMFRVIEIIVQLLGKEWDFTK